MKWFQQNRALGTLLLVSGICILLGAALLYWRWSVWSEAKQTFDQGTAERNRLQGLNPFPNDANYRKLQGYLEGYNDAFEKFKDELKNEVAPAPPLAPNEFQSRLRQATLAGHSRSRFAWTGTVASSDVHQHFARRQSGQRHVVSPPSVAGRAWSIANTDTSYRPKSSGCRETARHPRSETDRAQHSRSHFHGRARCCAKSPERNHKFHRPIFHYSHALRPQRKRQRPAARESRSAGAGPKPASISRPITRGRAELHCWKRARRSLSHHRDAAVYFLISTTDYTDDTDQTMIVMSSEVETSLISILSDGA